MVSVSTKGDWSKTFNFLTKAEKKLGSIKLDEYGQKGVRALSKATPRRTGTTADSWTYDIERNKDSLTLSWNNTNVVDGVNVAILIQYGHATKNGTYVQGIDYINPALKPVFDEIADDIWREVTK